MKGKCQPLYSYFGMKKRSHGWWDLYGRKAYDCTTSAISIRISQRVHVHGGCRELMVRWPPRSISCRLHRASRSGVGVPYITAMIWSALRHCGHCGFSVAVSSGIGRLSQKNYFLAGSCFWRNCCNVLNRSSLVVSVAIIRRGWMISLSATCSELNGVAVGPIQP